MAVAVLGLLVVLVAAPSATRSSAERVDALASELRCPDCQGLSVADSPTAAAAEIHRQIEELVASGASDDDVRAHFVARYGEWIRLSPSAPLVWLLPFLVVGGAAGALLVWLRGARPAGEDPGHTDEGPDAATRRQIRDEVEALDA
jgi:cytochrome c-type biogenesis protein CcmH